MKRMFIAYQTSNGFGNCTIDLKDNESIDDVEDIRRLQEAISKDRNLEGVIITNMIMLPIS